MQQKDPKMDACMLLRVLILLKHSINISSRFSVFQVGNGL